jgi:hypothetical protein
VAGTSDRPRAGVSATVAPGEPSAARARETASAFSSPLTTKKTARLRRSAGKVSVIR